MTVHESIKQANSKLVRPKGLSLNKFIKQVDQGHFDQGEMK